MTTAKLEQSPREKLFKVVSFDSWLPDGEEISDADVAVTLLAGSDMLDVQAFITAPDNRELVLASEGGAAASVYKALLLITATDGQKKEIRLDYRVREP